MLTIQLITIPAGEFVMGSTEEQVGELIKRFPEVDKRLFERELPRHKVYLPEYQIGKYEITNREFGEFIKATGNKMAVEIKKSDHPVVGVSWDEAREFCKWLSGENGGQFSLPTEAEWEKAARGTEGKIFPWGNEWKSENCNAEGRIRETTPVNFFETLNISCYGVVDMAGNVFEWTSTTIGNLEPWPSKYVYSYQKNDGREDAEPRTRRVGRGGSFARNEAFCRATFRFADLPTDRYPTQGFRVVRRK
jgi:toxoflavin biosynthesis protein ToxD